MRWKLFVHGIALLVTMSMLISQVHAGRQNWAEADKELGAVSPMGMGRAPTARLTIIDADGNPVEGATVELIAYVSAKILWTGKSGPHGHVSVHMDENLASHPADVVNVHYSIRVFADHIMQMGMIDIGFSRPRDWTNPWWQQIQPVEYSSSYTRSIHLTRVTETVTRTDASTLVVDVPIEVTWKNADVHLADVAMANGLRAELTFGSSSGYSHLLSVGYKQGGNAWFISGSRTVTSTVIAQTQIDGTTQYTWDGWDYVSIDEYTVPVYGPFSFKIEKWAHWVDCAGCNLGYYFYYIYADHYNGGLTPREYAWTQGYNGQFPAGSQGYMNRSTKLLSQEFASGYAWTGAFTVDTGYGSFTGGHTEQYNKNVKVVYTTPVWNPDYRQYAFYDRDWSQRNWWVKIVRY